MKGTSQIIMATEEHNIVNHCLGKMELLQPLCMFLNCSCTPLQREGILMSFILLGIIGNHATSPMIHVEAEFLYTLLNSFAFVVNS